MNELSGKQVSDVEAAVDDYRKRAIRLATALTAELTKDIDELDKTRKDSYETRAALANRLVAIEQRGQFAINVGLAFTLCLLIIAIFVSFWLLRWFPPEVASQIVQERTLVELGTGAFLLVTVVAFGAAKVLSGEAVGTVLGTIAGYVLCES